MRHLFGLGIFLFLLLPPLQGGEPIGEDAYWALIEETRQVVASGNVAAVRQQANRLEGVDEVMLTNGTVIPLSHAYLVSQMRAEDPHLDHLEETLHLMLDDRQVYLEAAASDEGALVSVEEATAERNEVLTRPEFQYRERPILDFFNRLLGEITSFTGRFSGVLGGTARFIISAVGLVIMIGGLGFALKRIVEGALTESRYNPGMEEMETLTAETALERARETSNVGDYRSAVRYLYLSTLLSLEERDLLRYDRTRTNLEYIRSLRDRPELATTLSDVVDVFDRVWYGFQEIDATTYERYAQRVAELQRQQ